MMEGYTHARDRYTLTDTIKLSETRTSRRYTPYDKTCDQSPLKNVTNTKNTDEVKCEVCSVRTVFKCKGCGLAYYCSRLHQKLDWKKHRRFCKTLNRYKALHERMFPQKKRHGRPLDTVRGPQDCFIDTKDLECYEQLVAFVYKALTTTGLCVIDNFVHESIAKGVLHETEATFISKSHRQNTGTDKNSTEKDDGIAWVTGHEKINNNIKFLCQTFQNLIQALRLENHGHAKLTHRSHVRVSCSRKDSEGYLPRVDSPSDDGRIITTAYHCNQAYERESCGGITRYYLLKTKYVDIEPKLNRAVIHWSDKRILHETLPCHTKLYTLTAWYLDYSKKNLEHRNKVLRKPPVLIKDNIECNKDNIRCNIDYDRCNTDYSRCSDNYVRHMDHYARRFDKTRIYYNETDRTLSYSASLLHERFKIYERLKEYDCPSIITS